MKNFTYIRATSEQGAVGALGKNALALAGGTDVLNLMKDHILEPEALVNIKEIPGLDKIARHEGGLRIGANCKLIDLVEDAMVRQSYPALYEALVHVATPQIRHMSTLGGNLCAQPRCWYYRSEPLRCRRRGGDSCPAVDGENEYLAIFGTDLPCVSVHPSSAAPALIVYGAKVRIAGPGGAREVGIEDFFTPPVANRIQDNVLEPNELVTHVTLPKPSGRSATYEVRQKESHDWPLALASVRLELSGNLVRAAMICLGGVAPVPWRSAAAEAILAGGPVTEARAAEAAAKAVEGARPLSQNRFKLQLTRAAVKRAILAAATGRRE